MTNTIQDHGQIKLLSLPKDFQEIEVAPADETINVSSIREFQVEGLDDTRLCFYYRGNKVSQEGGESFSKILSQKPHVLKDNEISDIKEVLDDVAFDDIFSSLMMATESINGKVVLKVEGTWIRQEWNMYALYVDASGDGRAIQQIYFLAPKASYLRFIPGIKNSMKNIEWSNQ